MDLLRSPFKGVVADVKGRAPWYKDDWLAGLRAGFGILAPTMYIFFASALPVIAFGEQLSNETNGILSTVETLASTAICGIIHAILGGQPMMIIGVAEPTIIMYTYLYNFAKKQPGLGERLYLAWAGWVCIWTAIMLFLLAMFNASNVISRFTRVAGELFGMLITVLFLQEAIKGIVSEFSMPKDAEISDRSSLIYQFQWIYVNGLLGVIFSTGLLYSALKTRRARSWLYGIGCVRSFIAGCCLDTVDLRNVGIHGHEQEEDGSISGSCDGRIDAEILDELTTHRGELKHRVVCHREERHLQVHSNAVQPSV